MEALVTAEDNSLHVETLDASAEQINNKMQTEEKKLKFLILNIFSRCSLNGSKVHKFILRKQK